MATQIWQQHSSSSAQCSWLVSGLLCGSSAGEATSPGCSQPRQLKQTLIMFSSKEKPAAQPLFVQPTWQWDELVQH